VIRLCALLPRARVLGELIAQLRALRICDLGEHHEQAGGGQR
jgi:hypothetical protein